MRTQTIRGGLMPRQGSYSHDRLLPLSRCANEPPFDRRKVGANERFNNLEPDRRSKLP